MNNEISTQMEDVEPISADSPLSEGEESLKRSLLAKVQNFTVGQEKALESEIEELVKLLIK